jgi:hypothetical protein
MYPHNGNLDLAEICILRIGFVLSLFLFSSHFPVLFLSLFCNYLKKKKKQLLYMQKKKKNLMHLHFSFPVGEKQDTKRSLDVYKPTTF